MRLATNSIAARWVIVGFTAACALVLLMRTRGKPPTVGSVRSVALTVVPSDEAGLRCQSEDHKGHTCEGDGTERLAPYVTVDGELLVLAGVFAHPWVQQEAAKRAKLPKKAQRFVVHCTIRLLGYANSTALKVQFGPADHFRPAEAWIAIAEQCSSQ